MSRTTRKIQPFHARDHTVRAGGDARLRWYGAPMHKRKMRPYNGTKWREKFTGMQGFAPWNSASPQSKLVARNANRAAKKALRQRYKREIRTEVQSLP